MSPVPSDKVPRPLLVNGPAPVNAAPLLVAVTPAATSIEPHVVKVNGRMPRFVFDVICSAVVIWATLVAPMLNVTGALTIVSPRFALLPIWTRPLVRVKLPVKVLEPPSCKAPKPVFVRPAKPPITLLADWIAVSP